MKISFSRLTGVMMCGLLLLTAAQQKARAQEVAVSYQTFYDDLSPYGQWVNDAEYGNVWVPNEEPGYRPYATRGHWVMTDNGNMWVSDVPWGWACYHYGRWTYNPYYGWVWIPGNEWAPAWVSWRSGGGCYGWAPMGPGYAVGATYDYPENYWVFVNTEYLYHPNVYSYYESRHTARYIRRTTYINETYVDNGSHVTYYYGPRREAIERETHQPVQVYRVSQASAPAQMGVVRGNEVNVYRPAVNRGSVSTAQPANVVRAAQPVGRPQQISNERGGQPQFRQDMQRQNGNTRGNNYNAAPTNRQEQPVNNRQSRYDEPGQYQRNNRTEQNNQREPQRQDRPQPGNFRQQNDRQPQDNNRPQPQRNPDQFNRPQPQRNPEPNRQPERQPDRFQQPVNRSQPQPQNQPMNRPQPQAQPQRGQPAPQPAQRQQNNQPAKEEKRR